MKLLLFGSQGMLGAQFFTDFADEFEIIPLSRFHIDLEDTEKIEGVIKEHSPTAVLNTAAFTDVDGAEKPSNKNRVFAINADAPEEMARVCEKFNIPFFHISTDYVFSGKEGDIFTEDSPKNPCNVYGASKAKGEDGVLKYQTSRVFRTAWLYGEYGFHFVSQIENLLKNRNIHLKGVTNEWGCPTSAKDVANVLGDAIKTPEKFPHGIYHAINAGKASRFEWMQSIAEILKIPVEIEPVLSTAFPPRPAKRPECSVVQNTKFLELRRWEEALKEYLGGK